MNIKKNVIAKLIIEQSTMGVIGNVCGEKVLVCKKNNTFTNY